MIIADLNHISTVLFMWKDKFEKKNPALPIEKLPLLYYPGMPLQHFIMQFMLYYVRGDCLKEAKKQSEISNL